MQARQPPRTGLLRSRFFWNLFASFAAVLATTGLLIGWQMRSRLEQGLLANLRNSLRSHSHVLDSLAAEALGPTTPGGLQDELVRLGKDAGMRITLVAPDGTVRGDSHEDPAGMDDHSNRPEIAEARTQPFGQERRLSPTLGIEMLYLARRVEREGRVLGFIRLAVPVQEVESQLAVVRQSVLTWTSLGVLVALGLGLYLASHITRPIADMTRTAHEFAAGNYGSRVRVSRRDELGLLGTTLNELGAEVTRRIAALSEEDAQLRAVLSGMVEGVVAVDEVERVAFINQAARRLLEIGEREPEGKILWQLAPIQILRDLLTRARRSGGHELLEFDLFRGGKERVFQAHVSPFEGGGKSGFVLVLHDTTELRRLERVRRDFVANVSHELKTPLTSIQGFVETLLSGALRDEENNVQFLRRIDANVRRLTSLVTDLLSLARIESGQLDVERAAVDWREVLDGVLRLRETAMAAKGLQLEVHGRERPTRVRGDREAMTQVLDNLIDNAIQYTPAGGRIAVHLGARGNQGTIAVEDSGIGIPSADLDRIFERFYRVDKARSRAAGGTGLGLSIVKNLVLRMEGDVRVESVEGQGSTFTVVLPLA